MGWSLAGRSSFEHRAVVLGGDRDELLAGLAELADGELAGSVITGRAAPAGKTVFVFPGQGSQWLGMGMGLHAAYPVFAEAFNTVVGELDRHLLRPLREVMWGHDESLLNTTEFAQPGAVRGRSCAVPVAGILGSAARFRDGPLGRRVDRSARRRRAVAGERSPAGGRAWPVHAGPAPRRRHDGRAGHRRRSPAAADRQRRNSRSEWPIVNSDLRRRGGRDRDRGPAARARPPHPQARCLARFPFSADGADDRRIPMRRPENSRSTSPPSRSSRM